MADQPNVWQQSHHPAAPLERFQGFGQSGSSASVALRVKLVPVHNDGGVPAGFAGIAEDASQQIGAEALAAETERRNAVASLTAGLAHNLNNILMVILGNVDQMVADLSDDNSARRSAEITWLAGQRAAAITRRLMVYSGQQLADIRPVPNDTAVARIKAALDASLPAGVRAIVNLGAGDATTVEVTQPCSMRRWGHWPSTPARPLVRPAHCGCPPRASKAATAPWSSSRSPTTAPA